MKFTRSIFVTFLFLIALAASAALLLSGSDAHVINVTAKIEPPLCDTRSIGFWANNEGCSHGAGSSDWDNEVQVLSSEYSGVFTALSGGDMCSALWVPNCPSGNTVEAKRCRATAHTLAVELNVASNRLHRSAFLAGADNGDSAFNRLHLFESSTVHEALISLESVLADSSASRLQLQDAATVAERIYAFYESENPFHPRCVFQPDDLPQCRPVKGDVAIINENTATVINVVETSANSGGDSTNGGAGGEGGTIETGDAATETVVENNVNTNITDVGCGDCQPCEPSCKSETVDETEVEATGESMEPAPPEQTESNESSAEPIPVVVEQPVEASEPVTEPLPPVDAE